MNISSLCTTNCKDVPSLYIIAMQSRKAKKKRKKKKEGKQ